MTEAFGNDPAQECTPRQKRAAGFATVLVPAALVFVSAATGRAFLAIWHELPWIGGPLVAVSASLMFLAAWLIVFPLRRKWKTGRFLAPRAEVMAKHAARWSKIGAGKPFWPQSVYVLFPMILSAVLIAFGVVLINVSLSCICPGETSRVPQIALLAMAALLFCLPGLLLFNIIRRKVKTGSFLVSPEELAKARARCANPRSLKQRILAAGLWWLIAGTWTFLALKHRHSASPDVFPPWMLATITWVPALLLTWRMFRPPAPQCAFPDFPDEPRTPEALPN
jgi:hypothetical protein